MTRKTLVLFLLSFLFFSFHGIARASSQPELVKDINPVFANGDVSDYLIVNNLVYYSIYDSALDKYYVYRHNLDTGKNLLISSDLASKAENFFNIGDQVYFTSGANLSRTDLYAYIPETNSLDLIHNIDSDRSDADPGFKNINNNLYFNVFDLNLNSEIYFTDGSAQGTFALKNNLMVGGISNLSSVIDLNGTMYFLAEDADHGKELWKADGMGGAELVKDINPGTASSNISSLTAINGALYFVAWDGSTGYELWKSDGTASGTAMVKDINPSSNSSNISTNNRDIFSSNGWLYFNASDGIHGNELWKSDGTASGTVMVKDINLGAESSAPFGFVEVNGVVYFAASTPGQGRELWKTDGTTDGTTIVEDMVVGAYGFSPASLTNFNNSLYFSAVDGVHGRELWKSSGAVGGTVMVKDINSEPFDSEISDIQIYNNNFYFKAYSYGDSAYKIWQSNGTSEGTNLLSGLMPGSGSSPNSVVNINGTMYFVANDGTNGNELWKSNGTASGTVMVKDIRSGATSSDPYNLTNVSGSLYFSANDGVNGAELWKSDGTASGTVMVKNIFSGNGNADPQFLTDVNGVLYFSASDGVSGRELWKSNGTASGTLMVKDLFPGVDDSEPLNFTNVNGLLFFRANPDGGGAGNLFRSDGSDEGTFVLGYNKFISPLDMISFKNKLYFSAEGPSIGEEIWSSDGTEDGTNSFTEIVSGVDGSHPRNLTKINEDMFFFSANDNVHGQELWKSDGTASGTVMVKDIWPGGDDSSISLLTAIGNKVYFSAKYSEFSGAELWRSDGTASGTTLVKDLTFTPMYGSYIGNITKVFNKVYFTANDNYTNTFGNGGGGNGEEMWMTDGTASGTAITNDFNEGINSSSPNNLNLINNYLYFVADDGTYGRELWRYQITAIPVSSQISPTITSGVVTVSTAITDGDNDPVDLYVDYSLDNGETWASSTVKTVNVSSGSISTTTGKILGITSTAVGNNLVFTWDTKGFGIISASQVKLKLTPYDGYLFGTPIISSAFSIDNTPLISLSKLTLSPVRATVNAEPDFLSIKLNARPSANVVLTPITSVDNILSFNFPTYTFTPDNWNTLQSLVVYAISTSSPTSANMTFSTASVDSNFNSLTPVASTTVAITVTNRTNNNSSSGTSSGSSGVSGPSSSSAGTASVIPAVSTAPTQVLTINQPSVITAPAVQTVQTTSSFISNNTSASLVIPAGTISIPATLEIKAKESGSVPLPQPTEVVVSEPTRPVGDVVFDISLKDNATNANITSFSSSNLQLTINIPTISSSEDITTLGLYYLNETTNQWIRVDNASFNLLSKQVTASLNHLTKFAVFKSTDKVLNTEETKATNLNLIPDDKVQTLSTTTPVTLPKLTTKQLTTYKGKFIKDKNNNSFYIDPKTKKLESVTKDNAIKYLAKTAVGIKNKDLIKINNLTDKKVSIFSKKFSNKVLIAIEDKGTLWYVNKDGRKTKIYDGMGLVRVMGVKY